MRVRGAPAVAVAALLAVAVLAAACGGSGSVFGTSTSVPAPTTTLPASSTTRPAPTTSTSAVPETTTAPTTTTVLPPPLVWARVPHDEAVFGGAGDQWASSVTAGGLGLVAVGGSQGPEFAPEGSDGDAVVWVSTDGLEWERIADLAVFGGPGDQTLNAVTAGGPGLVAVGTDTSGGDIDAAVWVSADGYQWERVPHDEAVFGGSWDQVMDSVTAFDSGLVAVGFDGSSWPGNGAVWLSANGYAWTRLSRDASGLGGEGYQALRTVITGGPGLVAAGMEERLTEDGVSVGWPRGDAAPGVVETGVAMMRGQTTLGSAVRRGEPTLDGMVWVSPDGRSWDRVGDPLVFGGAGDQRIYSLASGGSRLVAAGSDTVGGEDDAAFWWSDDGRSWEGVGHSEGLFGGSGAQAVYSVIAGGKGVVAAGEAHAGGGLGVGAVWVSTDGETWARADTSPSRADCAIYALAASGSRLVAVGYCTGEQLGGGHTSLNMAVWVSPPPD